MNIFHIIDLATTFFQKNSWQSKTNTISKYSVSSNKSFLVRVPLLIVKLILDGANPVHDGTRPLPIVSINNQNWLEFSLMTVISFILGNTVTRKIWNLFNKTFWTN